MIDRTMTAERQVRATAPRRAVATYGSYGQAQLAVDYLSDQRFPVERLAIVGEGLRLVERVTGRLTLARAALNGAGSGALTGALLGFLFGLFSWVTPLVSGLGLALYGLIAGAIIGAIFGLLAHAFSGGRRDFSSVGGMEAERYVVTADEEAASAAERLLTGLR